MAEGEEVVEQFGEQAGVLGKVVEQALDDTLHAQVQAVTQAFAIGFPADRRSGDFVDQAACRMAGTADQPLVQQGQLEQRNMQTCDQATQARWQVVIALDELEQQADQVDHVFIGRGDTAAFAAAHAHPQQQLFKLLAEIEVVCFLWGWYVMLQVRQQAQQVGRADRLRRRHRLQPWREPPTDRGKQHLKRSEIGLAGAVRIRFVVSARGHRQSSRVEAAVLGATAWRRLQLGHDARSSEQLIGVAIEHIDIPQDIALEQLEQDQLDPQPNPKATPGIEKTAA
ncbi:hypothetical protein D3C81_1124260 [compost metagenome]